MTNYESNSFHVIDEEQDTSAAFSTLPPSEAHGDAAMKLWHSTTLPDGQSINVSVCFTPDDIKGLQSYLNDQFGRGNGAQPRGLVVPDQLDYFSDGDAALLPKVGDTVHVVTAQVTGHQPDVDLFTEQAAAIDLSVGYDPVPGRRCAVIYNGNRCTFEEDHGVSHDFTPSTQTGDGAATPPAFAPTVTATANAGEQQAAESATGAGTPAVAPSPSSFGNPTNEPGDELPPTGLPQPAEATKPKRKRRTKLEIAFDTAKNEYERATYGGTPEQAEAARGLFDKATAALSAKDPGNERLAQTARPIDPEVAEVLSNNEPRTSGPSFAPEQAGFPASAFDGSPHYVGQLSARVVQPGEEQTAANYLAQEQHPINQQFADYAANLPGEHVGDSVIMTPEQYATVPTFQPGQAPQLGQVSVSPEEQQAASGFPCPVQSSDGRTCVRPYGHEIQTENNPEPKPHVYATVPSQLGVTTAQAMQAVEQSLPAFQAAGHSAPTDPLPWTPPPLPVAEPVNEHSPFQGPPPASPLSFQVPPTPAAVPAPEPTGAVHQPPAPAAPFWQQPNG